MTSPTDEDVVARVAAMVRAQDRILAATRRTLAATRAPVALLDDVTAQAALQLLAAGASVRTVAEEYGSTSIWCMYDLRGGRTHEHLPRA